MMFPEARAQRVVDGALDEDLGGFPGLDVTTFATIPEAQLSTAHVVARADGVLAGLPLIPLVFRAVTERIGSSEVDVELLCQDGDPVRSGEVIAILRGSTRATLVGERTMLNLLSRLSGVATHTRAWVDLLDGTGAKVLDTRKTTPGLRALEKYAVRCGGGTNKRIGLHDVAMIKDNHKRAAGSVSAAFEAVHLAYPAVAIQVEVTTTAEALEAVAAGARFLMCDNMSVELLRQTVEAVRGAEEAVLPQAVLLDAVPPDAVLPDAVLPDAVLPDAVLPEAVLPDAVLPEAGRVEIEATGGLTLETARAYAETGVDFLSVGGLTHSSPILDIALDLVDSKT